MALKGIVAVFKITTSILYKFKKCYVDKQRERKKETKTIWFSLCLLYWIQCT